MTTEITTTITEPQSTPEQSTPEPPPELTSYPATERDDLVAALRLVADSVAQQRQTAAKGIIFHPIWLGTMAAVLAVVHHLLYTDSSDLPLIATTAAGCLMAGLVVVRFLTGGYIEVAEEVGTWAWLDQSDNQDEKDEKEERERVVLVTRYGGKIIGTLVVQGPRGRKNGSGKGKKKAQQVEEQDRAVVIRAWTVQQRYRGQGVGRDLLERAVAVCRERRWEDPVFDEKHANSRRLLPGMFNGRFERNEVRARASLDKLIRSDK